MRKLFTYSGVSEVGERNTQKIGQCGAKGVMLGTQEDFRFWWE